MKTPYTHAPHIALERLGVLRNFVAEQLNVPMGTPHWLEMETTILERPIRVKISDQTYTLQTEEWKLLISPGLMVRWFDGDLEAFERDYTLLKMVSE